MTSTAMETKQRPWWLLLIAASWPSSSGAILLFSGPIDAARTWVRPDQVLGIWWLISGIFDMSTCSSTTPPGAGSCYSAS